MKKEKTDNHFIWSGLAGGISSLMVFTLGGNLPVAIASGAAIFAVGSLIFRKPRKEETVIPPSPDEKSILENGCAEVKIMHELTDTIDDGQIRENARDVYLLCDKIIDIVSKDENKLKKSTKLFTYYIPTINKTLSIYRKLEASDTDRTVYSTTLKFLNDCENGLQKHIENLNSRDIMDLSVEMETMTTVMGIDGLVENSDKHAKLRRQN